MAEPYNEIKSLPANSNGARTVLEEHLDVNNGIVHTFLAALVQATFAAGGVIEAGTITVEADDVTITVQGRSGITDDRQAAVVVTDQSVDCSSITDGNKARVYISRELGEHIQVNFTDADTAEALSHTLGVVLGKLEVIEGDSSNYPALPPGSVPVAQISKAGGVVSIDAAENDAPTLNGAGGGGGSTPALAPVAFSFDDDGAAYLVAPEAMTLAAGSEAGTGTVAYAKALAADTATFSAASLPVSLAAGDVLRVSVSGLSGYKAVALERTA